MWSYLRNSGLMPFCMALLYCLNLKFFDFLFFSLFNGHLIFMPWIYTFVFAILNHRYENFFNIFLVSSAIIWVFIKYMKNKKSALLFILLLAIWYEIGFQIIHRLENWPLIARHSPSLEYAVYFDLSKIHPLAKVYAPFSFPSGHAMIFGYFGALSQVLFPLHLRNRYKKLSFICCIPRLVSGAHAMSDIIAGYAVGILLWKSLLWCIQAIKTINEKIAFETAVALPQQSLDKSIY